MATRALQTPSTSHPAGAVPPGDGVQAVLWDMDGTIVDTEPYWIEAETQLVKDHGGTWSDGQASALVGQALSFSARLLQEAGVDLTEREIIDHLISRVVEKVRVEVPWRPGARELLEELRSSGVPCALVTMSERLLATEIAAQLPEGTFEFLVTGDMVERGKPDPEAYRTAFERLAQDRPGLSPARVVAIEDSLPGVTSALAAGVVTLAVPHFVPLPKDPARTDWTTLEGRTLEDLNGVVRDTAARGQ
ncbi:HAD family phosphatase [Arthrobacter frigidicola]|nr:HAD family phosphatase [Arthrobacter frigidicola]